MRRDTLNVVVSANKSRFRESAKMGLNKRLIYFR